MNCTFLIIPIKYEQGQTNSRDDSPCEKSVKSELNSLSDPTVSHKSVQNPQGDVGKQQKGDQLPSRFGVLLCSRRTNPSTSLRHD